MEPRISPTQETEIGRGDDRLRRLLSSFDNSPAAYLEISRELERAGPEDLGLREIRLSLLATFTIDVLLPYLTVEGARRGLAVRGSIAPFGQLEQQLLEPDSPVYRSGPQVIVLAARVEEVTPALVHDFLRLSPAEVEREVEQFAERLGTLVHAVRAHSGAQVLVWNQAPPTHLAAGLADAGLAPSQTSTIAEINRRTAALCRGTPGAHVFDVCRVANEVGLSRWQDLGLFHLARVPLSAPAQIATAARLARCLRALAVPPCKCLVLDLDNTLWGGVLGESGAAISLGEDYPGNVFKAFQRQLRTYRDRGILLAIASKNNERDVVELFEKHPDLVLRWSDFAARQIHWNDKASSLVSIAEELHISTEALAFFDDSPVEREWVRTRMPEVRVIDVPDHALHYGTALEESGVFDHLVLTDEDRARAELYRTDQERRQLAQTAPCIEEFLGSLRMRVTIAPVDSTVLPRVAQLVSKTNQFNLTARRHSQADLERLIAAGAIALSMRVEDRFGDNGLVGLAIAVEHPPDAAALDTFLLSCRVMGRRVERALLVAVARRAAARGAARLLGEFIPTAKNAPAAGFFAESGFLALSGCPGWWQLDLTGGLPAMPPIFEVLERA